MQGGRCLVLNSSYEFLHVTNTWFDSFMLLYTGKVQVVEHYPQVIRSAYEQFQLPAVAVLTSYVATPKKRHQFTAPTKRNILLRDKCLCAYCGRKLSMHTVTKDHVLPTSRGGSDTMNNVVAACFECNTRKADRTPEEARMPLRQFPRALSEAEKLELLVKSHKTSERTVWKDTLDRLEIKLF